MNDVRIGRIVTQTIHRSKAYGSAKGATLPVRTRCPQHICRIDFILCCNLILIKYGHECPPLSDGRRKICDNAQILGLRELGKFDIVCPVFQDNFHMP